MVYGSWLKVNRLMCMVAVQANITENGEDANIQA